MSHPNIYYTWIERIEAPELTPSMIRQFKDAIALKALTYSTVRGKRTALDVTECSELYQRFLDRVSRDGGPKVTSYQADQGRKWLDRYWKKGGLPEADYRAILCFRFVDIQVFNENTYPYANPIYECDWGDEFARLRYVPIPWQRQGPPTAEWWWVYANNYQKEPVA